MSSATTRHSKYSYRASSGGIADVNIEYSADLTALTRLEVMQIQCQIYNMNKRVFTCKFGDYQLPSETEMIRNVDGTVMCSKCRTENRKRTHFGRGFCPVIPSFRAFVHDIVTGIGARNGKWLYDGVQCEWAKGPLMAVKFGPFGSIRRAARTFQNGNASQQIQNRIGNLYRRTSKHIQNG